MTLRFDDHVHADANGFDEEIQMSNIMSSGVMKDKILQSEFVTHSGYIWSRLLGGTIELSLCV